MAKSLDEIIQQRESFIKAKMVENEEVLASINEENEKLRLELLRQFNLNELVNNNASSAAAGSGGKVKNRYYIKESNVEIFIYKNFHTNTYFNITLDYTNKRINQPVDLGVPFTGNFYWTMPLQGRGLMHFGNDENNYGWAIFVDTSGNIIEKVNTNTDFWTILPTNGNIIGIAYNYIGETTTIAAWDGLTNYINKVTIPSFDFSINFTTGDDFVENGTFFLSNIFDETTTNYAVDKNLTLTDITNLAYKEGNIVANNIRIYGNSNFITFPLYNYDNGHYDSIRIADLQGNIINECDISSLNITDFNNYNNYGWNRFVIAAYSVIDEVEYLHIIQYNGDSNTFNVNTENGNDYDYYYITSHDLPPGIPEDSPVGSNNLVVVLTGPRQYHNGLYKSLMVKCLYLTADMTIFGTYLGVNDTETETAVGFGGYYGNSISLITSTIGDSVKIVNLTSDGIYTHDTEILYDNLSSIDLMGLNGNAVICLRADYLYTYLIDNTGNIIDNLNLSNNSNYYHKGDTFVLFDYDTTTIYYNRQYSFQSIVEDTFEGLNVSSTQYFYNADEFIQGNFIFKFGEDNTCLIINNLYVGPLVIPENTDLSMQVNTDHYIILYKQNTYKVNLYNLLGQLINTSELGVTSINNNYVIDNRILYTNVNVDENNINTIKAFLVNDVYVKDIEIKAGDYYITSNDYAQWYD